MSGFSVTARTASEALPILARQIMTNGDIVESRAGNTRELLYPHICLTEPWKREILTPGRHADIRAQIAETAWVLAGRSDVEWLSHYLPRAKDFSDDGKVWRAGYGPRLRNWNGVDQIRETVDLLLQDNGTRRAVMSLWDPSQDYEVATKDVPCNNWLHFLIREDRLNLHVVIRSNDLIWGWSGINAFEWSVMQEIVASLVGVGIGTLEFSISSLHIYERHFSKAEKLARAKVNDDLSAGPENGFQDLYGIEDLDRDLDRFFEVEELVRNRQPIRFDQLPQSQALKEWLWVLMNAETGTQFQFTNPRLEQAIRERPKPKAPVPELRPQNPTHLKLALFAADLHARKHSVYGDSWKKRGEKVSIQANIARKIDRLGKAGAGDDNLDTAVDLLNYLFKYELWLEGKPTDGPAHAIDVHNELVRMAKRNYDLTGLQIGELERDLADKFEALLRAEDHSTRLQIVLTMRRFAFWLAVLRYEEMQENHVILRQRLGDDGPNYEADNHA